jgi:hypothetical protein
LPRKLASATMLAGAEPMGGQEPSQEEMERNRE